MKHKPTIGINGFGRIGKQVYHILKQRGYTIPFINDPVLNADTAIYSLKYDSVHKVDCTLEKVDEYSFKYTNKKYNKNTSNNTSNTITNNTITTTITNFYDPKDIPWSNTDIVIESTGLFLTTEKAKDHLRNKKMKVIITAPSKDAPTFIYGVNHFTYKNEQIISNSSCTTNCLAPLIKLLNDEYKIKEALMSTVHSITSTQRTVDTLSNKLRLTRSMNNIIPSTTGAAKSISLIIPEMKNKITGMAIRVNSINVSLIDLTVKLENKTSLIKIFNLIKKNENKVIKCTDEEVVSSDFIGCTYSCVVDEKACIELNDTFFKIVAWYDNEWGYSERVVDMVQYVYEAGVK